MIRHFAHRAWKWSFIPAKTSRGFPEKAAPPLAPWSGGTIKSRLYFILLAALLPVFVTQIVMHYNHFQTHRDREFQADLQIARSIAETFDGLIRDVVRQTAAIGVAITLRQPSSLRTIEHILSSAKAEWSNNIELCWIDSTGHMVASTDDSMVGLNPRACPYFARIAAGEDWFLGDLVEYPNTGQKRFAIGHAVHDATGGLIGMAAARIAPELLREELSLQSSSEGALTLFDRAGKVVYRHSGPASATEAPRWLSDDFSRQITKALAGQEVTAIVRGMDGKEKMIVLAPVRPVGWVVGVERPKSLVMETVYSDFVRGTCLFFVVALCSAGFASIVSSTIINPIRELRNHATALGSGQPAPSGKVRGPSELEELSNAFEAMAREVILREDALRKMHEKLEERVKERTAELSNTYDALKAEMGERIQAEKALRLSEARLRHVYENSPAMMCSVDEDGLICNVNRKWLEVMGYEYHEVIGKREDSFLHADPGKTDSGSLISELWSRGCARAFPCRYVKKDGSYIDAILDCDVTDDPSGKKIRLSAAQDVTQQRRAEERLLRNKAMLKAVFEGIPEPLIMLDESLRVQMLNNASLKYYQVKSQQEAVGKYCTELNHSGWPHCVNCSISSALSAGGNVTFERRGLWDSKRSEQVDVYPIQKSVHGMTGAIVRITDITEKKEIEKQLVRVDRLSSLGQLSGGIAHEIRNPLAGINLFVDILSDEERFDRTGQEQEIFKEIKESIYKVNGIIQRVLDFAKQTDSSMTNLDVNSLVKDTLQLWHSKMEKQGIKLALSLEESLPPILGDAIGIQQVVNNLVQNAIEAINEDGSLSISTGTGAFSFDGSRPVVVLKVQDSGTGIDEADQDSVFNPFFTTKPTGTGLGLPISYKIIERHGGIIYYESKPAPITTFTVELPVSA